MKRQRFQKSLLVGILTLAICTLVAVLLVRPMTARSDITQDTPPSKSHPLEGFEVNRILLPKLTAAYNSIFTPALSLHAPWFLNGTSNVRVYNAGEDTATVYARFTYPAGVTTTQSALAPGALAEIKPRGIDEGIELSAILTSTQPIVAVVNDFGPDNNRATSYAAMPASLGRTHLALPDVLANNAGWDSQIVVQNVGVTTASVSIFYTNTNPYTPTVWSENVLNLSQGATHAFTPEDASNPQGINFPDVFEGIAIIQSDQPLVAIVRNSSSANYNAHIYRVPLPQARGDDKPFYFPMLANDFQDWTNSEIQVMNAGATRADFTVHIESIIQAPRAIDAWHAKSFPQDRSADEGIQSPKGLAVHGRIEQARDLHSLVWLRGSLQGDSFASYSTPSVGARALYLPYTDQGDDFTTLVFVQNTSAQNATLSLTYHNMAGITNTILGETLGPFEMQYYAVADDFNGGVVIQADQPVTAISIIAGRLILNLETYLPIVFRP